MDSFDDIVNKIWENTPKAPLQEMYDSWCGEDNWGEHKPRKRFVLYAKYDIALRNGTHVLSGKEIACTICGRVDNWNIENVNEKTGDIINFSCFHGFVHAGRGHIRNIDDISAKYVGRMERVQDCN